MIRRNSGFTLLEIMISVGISSVTALAVFGVLAGQLVGISDQNKTGEMQNGARQAMDTLHGKLSMTGFGLPPLKVFGPTSLALNNATGGDAYGTCAGTDVVEVRARDPRGTWQHKQSGSSASAWAGNAAPIDPLFPNPSADLAWPMGARLLIVPQAGAGIVVRTAAARASGSYTVSLNTAESAELGIAANNKDGVDVFLINTWRFRVICSDAAHPMLVLETDTDVNQDGTLTARDQIPIANDIEDLQVAYLVDIAGTGSVADATAMTWAQVMSSSAPDETKSKIKALRVTVVSRTEAFIAGSQVSGATRPVISEPFTIEDHTPTPHVDTGFARRRVSEIIVLDNRNTKEPAKYAHFSNRWL